MLDGAPGLAEIDPSKADDLWGGQAIDADAPVLRPYDRVICTPYVEHGRWGVFDAQGRPCTSALDWWLPQRFPLRQIPVSDLGWNEVADTLPADCEYIYGGRMVPHFGHFLIETMSRLWVLARQNLQPHQRLIFHGPGHPEQWWELAYVRACLGALGVAPAHVVGIDRPVRIARLLVPDATFRPQARARPAFRDACVEVGRRLLADRSLEAVLAPGTPVYLSKSRVPEGVRRIANEVELEQELSRRGIVVIHPETMSLAEQISLFQTCGTVGGIAGSAHHMSAFADKSVRFRLLLTDDSLNSNFVLIDKLNGNDSLYFRAQSERIHPINPTFIITQQLSDPTALAEIYAHHLLG